MNQKAFKPKAKLLLHLGDQLIKNEAIAIIELVKNSYDADASKAAVYFKDIDKKDIGEIIISDNGEGMTKKIVEDVWMEPGSDYKLKKYKKGILTKKYKRLPIGEKGIGRFGAHKLGDQIEVVTKSNNDKKEQVIQIDWREFNRVEYLEDVFISIKSRAPQIFTKNKTGTRITVNKLRTNWTRGMYRDVFRAIMSLTTPFYTIGSFNPSTELTFNNEQNEEANRKKQLAWEENLLLWKDIKKMALFEYDCTIRGSRIIKFDYSFKPWLNMDKLKPRKFDENSKQVKKILEITDNDGNSIDLSQYNIGKISFKALIYDFDSKILSKAPGNSKSIKDYLRSNGGVRIFRDGFRVYDYGEPGNDWLNLDIRRVNVPARYISNNIIIGAINLDRRDSSDLVEKTNREGFVDNNAYKAFKQSILYSIDKMEGFRSIDKNLIRKYYGPTAMSEPVISGINELRKLVKNKVKDNNTRLEAVRWLNKIEKDYREINNILLRSAGSGMNLSIVLHEIEKITKEVIEIVVKTKTSGRAVKLIMHLSKLIEGYSLIVGKSDIKKVASKKLIRDALFNVDFRFKAHKIKIEKAYLQKNKNITLKCASNLIISSILNILDNSIWWFHYARTTNKKIYIDVRTNKKNGDSCIIIADNGPGFATPTEYITEPFVSMKPNGMGLGLYLAKEIMVQHKGSILFPDWNEYKIPEEYKGGAIVVLAFRN